MDENICLLLTLLYENQLLKCALKTDVNKIPEDILEYPMEIESREFLHNLLPEHIKLCGPIVDVKFLFDICIV